jgi:hypothetical protein
MPKSGQDGHRLLPNFDPNRQIFFDLVPLRLIPTLIFGVITYLMVHLRPGFRYFVRYEVFLSLLVMTSAVINLVGRRSGCF